MAKECLVQLLWELAAAETYHLHSDNGILNAELFVEDCKKNFQMQSFSGVDAHHQTNLVDISQFKLSCAWARPLWFIFVCIRAITVLIILHFGVLP